MKLELCHYQRAAVMGKEWLYHLGSNSSSSNRSSTKRGKTSSSRRQIRDGSSSSSSSTSTRTSSSTSFSGCLNAIFQLFNLHQFHFPNLHPQQPPSSSSSSFNPPHDFFLPQLQPPIHLKGVEAPRNSLEMDDTSFMGAPTSISSNSTLKQRDTFKIPMGGIQIKTSGHTRSSRRRTDLNDVSSSECVYSSSSSSPAGTSKTPTLVARLMGLDLLPETSSPRPSSSSSVSNLSSSKSQLHHQRVQNPRKKTKNDDVIRGSRSLPNTPRTSSARRSDVVDQRFSLQINKENNNNELATIQEFEFSKFLTTKIAAADRRSKGDETMSPGHYAKQIVQQFKENVSRRIGGDITNTVENNRSEQRRDQHVVLLKSKKPPSSNIGDCHDQSTAPNSCSPRLRFLEIKNKTSHSPKLSTSPLSPFTDTAQSKSATVATSKPKAQTVPLKEEQKQIMTQQSSNQKCNKIDSEMLYRARLKKPLVRSKKEESFVRSSSATSSTRAYANHLSEKKKCKQTPLSNVSTILSIKKDPSPPATRLPQQQEERKQYDQSSKVFDNTFLSRKSTELPSCSSHSYKQEPNSIITVTTDINSNDGTTTVSSTTGSDELIEYISRILECTGIHEFTPVSFTKWYSPSHPLDPSLFHNLRFSYPKLELNCEKLVFDVVDELLAEILRPLTNLRPWVNWIARNDHILMYGLQLIDTLFARIQSFPSADCRVLEDIDAVVEKDLGSGRERSSSAVAAFEEEGDGIVIEIEGDILDTLVHEMVVAMVVFGVRTR